MRLRAACLTNCLTTVADQARFDRTSMDTTGTTDLELQHVNHPLVAFGTKKSQVQILSPRRSSGLVYRGCRQGLKCLYLRNCRLHADG